MADKGNQRPEGKENMEHLKKYISINSRFQKSVNLSLDLGNALRIGSYIPTRASLQILKYYLNNILENTGENATVLIGPYGKGKSHLLLLLLAFLQGEQSGVLSVLSRTEQTDREAAEMIRRIYREKKRFLPVLVSGRGTDLNHSFLYGLKEGLERENLKDLIPENNYSEALKTLKLWRREYPEVYLQWEEFLADRGETSVNVRKGLNRMDERAMGLFLECYPRLTAGSRFLPMFQSDAMSVYRQVGRKLTEQYGYAGIVMVFDEFSKYMEGHGTEHFARDMKTLQDMCELANSSGEQNLHLILVAHKSIHEYEKGLDRLIQDTFRGVEGRLREVRFHDSARTHYELIANTLCKKEPEFSKEFSEYKKESGYQEILEQSYGLHWFSSMFPEYEGYEQVMGKGCFPLTPVCAAILLHISERVAQNERTVFTFLAGRERGSLPGLLEESAEYCVGADAVYDYFRPLFRESSDQPRIHSEWLKADYALKQTQDPAERKIIKALGLLRMIHQEEELPAVEAVICPALGMRKDTCQKALESLRQQELILFRSSLGVYGFKNHTGLNIDREIEAEMAKQPEKFPVCSYLDRISDLEYVLPRQYNQERNMTRYFRYEFLAAEDFFRMETVSYLFEEAFSDGKILALVSEEEMNWEKVREKTESLQDDRIVVLVPEHGFDMVKHIRKLAAVYSLKQRAASAEEHKVLLRELELYEEDIVFEINASLERNFVPGYGKCGVARKGEPVRTFAREMDFNRMLSEICEQYYAFSPVVNHELLNIQHVSGQYLRARNKVVNALLREQAEIFRQGTAPEHMVYRAAFVRTGILDTHYEKDTGCGRILDEIDGFLVRCIGRRRTFQELYQRLQGRDYGVRKGILPLFLAQRLGMAEGIPVIYLQKKELEVNEEVLNSVNDFPQDYELYLEPESGKKERYLRTLEGAWPEEGPSSSRQNRWIQLMEHMQKWYRSLPKYARVARIFPEEEQKKAERFRSLLKRSDLNPREFLFERIPELMTGTGQEPDLQKAAEQVLAVRNRMEQAFSRLQSCVAEDVRSIFGGKEQESLKGCLLSWYGKQGAGEPEYILNKDAHSFLEYLKNLNTNDELEMISCLSRLLLDLSMEDWNDDTPEVFLEKMRRVKQEVEQTAERRGEQGTKTIILMDEQGQRIKRSYQAEISDTTSSFLKNMIDEAMEDFEDTLEISQKVAVLAEVLQELMKRQ